jgi:hypothetical protein
MRAVLTATHERLMTSPFEKKIIYFCEAALYVAVDELFASAARNLIRYGDDVGFHQIKGRRVFHKFLFLFYFQKAHRLLK